MEKGPAKTRVIRFKIPRYVSCPFCGKKQHFKKEKEHYRFVKDINIEEPMLLKLRVVYAKCKNPESPKVAIQKILYVHGDRWKKSAMGLNLIKADSIISNYFK